MLYSYYVGQECGFVNVIEITLVMHSPAKILAAPHPLTPYS